MGTLQQVELEASVLAANIMKMVSMQRAEIASQSMKPRA